MATSTELPLNSTVNSTRGAHTDATLNEIAQLKRQLLQAEVRLAKARANAAGAEADVKVLSARLRAVSK
jgi:capsule polysaccharide export protein KpsE/RkpR